MKKKKPKNYFPFVSKLPQKKEYEMPEEYTDNLLKLTKMIEERDKKAEIIKTLPPEKRAEALPALSQLNGAVDKIEQSLADEYEEFQEEKRREAEVSDLLGKGMDQVEKLYIIAKHQMPSAFFEGLKKVIIQDMTPDEEQEFYDKIAVLESTKLKDILAGK